jgi:hypothetical protein
MDSPESATPEPTQTTPEHEPVPEIDVAHEDTALSSNSDLQAIFDRVNSGVRSLLARSAPAGGSQRNSARQITDYLLWAKESMELSGIETKLEKLRNESPHPDVVLDPKLLAQKLDGELKTARKRITSLRGSARHELPTHIPENAVAMSRQKEEIAGLQTEVELLQRKLYVCDKRISVMTQNGSAYGQSR